jgi:hypothetical protein
MLPSFITPAADPAARVRVSQGFPMINLKSGGTIYQWTLGWHVSPHDVAREFGHEEINLLMEHSPADVKLIAACWAGDENAVKLLVAENPGPARGLTEADRRQVAHAARATTPPPRAGGGLPVGLGHTRRHLHWAAMAMWRWLVKYCVTIRPRSD